MEHSESSSAKNMDGGPDLLEPLGISTKGKRRNNTSYLRGIVLSSVSFLAIVEGAKNIFAPLCIQVVKWEGTFAVARGSWPLFFFICNEPSVVTACYKVLHKILPANL